MARNPPPDGPAASAFVDRFEALVESLPPSRSNFARWMRTAEVADDVISDLEVVFSELTTNAVAGSPSTADDIGVRAEIDDGMLVLEVSNHLGASDQLSSIALDMGDPLRRDGRGLLITRAFMHSVDVQTDDPDRLVMRCCRRIAPERIHNV